MPMHTMTAMFHSRSEAERAAATLRSDASLAATNVKVLPEEGSDLGATEGATGRAPEGGGFMTALRNFFMPEEDRYGFAEGLRRGDYMVAVDTDEQHVHQVMDVLEQAGAIDMDAEEARWRSEGWTGYEPSSSATARGSATTGTAGAISEFETATIPPVPGTAGTVTSGVERGSATAGPVTSTQTTATGAVPSGRAAGNGATLGQGGTVAAGTEERIPLVQEELRVGKRQVMQGRVRIRSYVVETPVTETVHLRDEHIQVERRPVDRPLTGNEADPFREREIEATETREEAVVSKDARVREELVLHKSVEERDETIRDTVRHTEVREDRGDDAATDASGTVRDPGTPPRP